MTLRQDSLAFAPIKHNHDADTLTVSAARTIVLSHCFMACLLQIGLAGANVQACTSTHGHALEVTPQHGPAVKVRFESASERNAWVTAITEGVRALEVSQHAPATAQHSAEAPD